MADLFLKLFRPTVRPTIGEEGVVVVINYNLQDGTNYDLQDGTNYEFN